MSEVKGQEIEDISIYIKNLKNQELKVLLLKLKNEIKKSDVTWEQIKDILLELLDKDKKVFAEIIPLILKV